MCDPDQFQPDYVLIGHIAHDITPDGPRLGGTVSFAAYTAAAFGLRVGILTSAAPGEPLLRDLPPDTCVITTPADHTTTFENQYIGGTRTQHMYHRAATLTSELLPMAWRSASMVHLGPIAYEVDPGLLDSFGNASICATPQGWMRGRKPDGLVITVPWPDAARVLPRTTLTVLSKEDIRHDPGLETIFAELAPLLVVTDGMHGGTVYQNGQSWRFPAIEIIEVDPTGAGDVFATVLNITYAQTDNLPRAIKIASYLAGLSVSRIGFASAPTREEIAEALRRFPA